MGTRWIQDEWGGHWGTDAELAEYNPTGQSQHTGSGRVGPDGNPYKITGTNDPAIGTGARFYQEDIGKYGSMADKYRGMTGQNIDRSMIDRDIVQGQQSRNEMLGALSMLAQRAQTGDTQATQQLRQAQAQNMASLRGGAMSARGGGAARAAAAQAARSSGARSGQSNAVGMGALRAAEMDRARQQYMQQATALRAADLQRRGMSAEEAFRQANLNQEAYGLGQRTALGYEGMREGEEEFAQNAAMAGSRRAHGQAGRSAVGQINSGSNLLAGAIGGLASGIGGGLAMGNRKGDY